MIAAWIDRGRVRVRDDLPRPSPEPGEAIVRVLMAGICGTDLELLRGYRDFSGIPGHEFVGRVEEGPPEWVGARVVAEINITCRGRRFEPPCFPCANGRLTHCLRREAIGIRGRDGAFAEWLRVPVPNLHRVPEPLPDEVAVFAEPVAAACRVLRQIEADIRRDLDRGRVTRALVVGAGRLGQLVARVLARRLPELEVAGRSERSLARARAAGLATVSAAAVEEAAYDLVVDCSGASAGFAVARQAVRPRGTMILKSTHKNELDVDISSIVVDEIRLLGSRCGSFDDALLTLERREFEVRDLIDDRLPLSAAPEAFEQAAEAGIAKVLLVP
ncbi:alcohol dehydrogenase catalytic domain-containing protein [Candidatus Palauibacter polyketidifaciens]|uniref:alcohol dehydrogenase catalytic domain-containing protein n=1 Tax=Candidatus Palauibacter polyketidifaciens TaxID=3056740 RepID=UPI002392EEA4|nr:alcohol dehydrogenase catalytic domain-containing protein [Candidatus Palauibacter polyketidifaciens]MDE2719359.1 alcohol dehydrogenase catalytic domain-containing protein [Candidatus Palauibacter polyketidifaciens]